MARILIILLAFVSVSCKSDLQTEKGVDVKFIVKATFGGEPLMMYGKDYPYPGARLRFQLFNFYLSDIRLRAGSEGQGIRLAEVALINFRDIQTSGAADKGFVLTFKNVPAGSYTGLEAGVGVAPRLNATGPASYPPPHPLDDNYWSWAAGYVFAKVEGNADLDNSGKFATKLTFHAGGDSFYKTVKWDRPIVLHRDNAEIALTLDLKEMLWRSDSDFIDFRKVTIDHSVDKQIVAFLLDNLQKAIQLR